jgi:hypothetical protein
MLKHSELVHFKTPTVKPSPFDFGGRWINEPGSYMDLKVDGIVVTGHYVSMVTENGAGTNTAVRYLPQRLWRPHQLQRELGCGDNRVDRARGHLCRREREHFNLVADRTHDHGRGRPRKSMENRLCRSRRVSQERLTLATYRT